MPVLFQCDHCKKIQPYDKHKNGGWVFHEGGRLSCSAPCHAVIDMELHQAAAAVAKRELGVTNVVKLPLRGVYREPWQRAADPLDLLR